MANNKRTIQRAQAMLGGALMVYHEEKPNKAENPGIAMLGGSLMVPRNNPTRQKILESPYWAEL